MSKQNEWEELALQATDIQDAKNKVINDKLLHLVNDSVADKQVSIFDYGCGWGEWAGVLSQGGFELVEGYDEADDMVDQAREKFGSEISFYKREEFKSNLEKFTNKYDLVTSNLVLCILEKDHQLEMLKNIRQILKPDGTAVISFCHPCFDYDSESVISNRIPPSPAIYNQKFTYEKVIKENGIHFHDLHRPLEYFSDLFKETGFKICEIKESEVLNTEFKPDFIIFKLK